MYVTEIKQVVYKSSDKKWQNVREKIQNSDSDKKTAIIYLLKNKPYLHGKKKIRVLTHEI